MISNFGPLNPILLSNKKITKKIASIPKLELIFRIFSGKNCLLAQIFLIGFDFQFFFSKINSLNSKGVQVIYVSVVQK